MKMKTKIKKSIIVAFYGLLMITFSYGQEPSASDLLTKLSKISDQYGDKFDPTDVDDKITLIFVEGTNSTFSEIYAKFKGKKLVKNVRVVAGWKNVMPDTEYKSKFKHMTDGFKSKEGLGKEGYSILFDLNSESHKLLGLKVRYSIATVDVKENQVDVENFGSDRIEFLKAIRKFFI